MEPDEPTEVALNRLFGELRSLAQGDLGAPRLQDAWVILSEASALDHARCVEVFAPYLRAHASAFDGADVWWSADSVRDALRQLHLQRELIPSARACVEVNGDPLADDALEAFAADPAISCLRELLLIDCAVTARGAQALAASTHLPRLEVLNLRGCDLDGDAFSSLSGSKLFESLRHLDVSSNPLDQGWWSVSPCFLYALERLDMSRCGLGDIAARLLSFPLWLATVRELDLSHNVITDEGARDLAGSSSLSYGLRKLDLDGNRITEAGWRALADSPHMSEPLRASFRSRCDA